MELPAHLASMSKKRPLDAAFTPEHVFQESNRDQARRSYPATPSIPNQTQYIVIHRVICDGEHDYHSLHDSQADFFDVPYMARGSNRTSSLRGQKHIANLEGYFEDHPEISLATCITYRCSQYHEDIKDAFKRYQLPPMDEELAFKVKPYFFILQEDAGYARPTSETIILSGGLQTALAALRDSHPESLDKWDDKRSWKYPYLQFFHCKDLYTGASASRLNQTHQHHLRGLSSYLDEHLAEEYAEAEALFEDGLVNKKHWAKLFRPNEVIVTKSHGEPLALMSTSCPTLVFNSLYLNCWSWGFDGKFYEETSEFNIIWPGKPGPIPISDLPAYPLRLDKSGLKDRLQRRGDVFWTCRKRKYVSYDIMLTGVEVQMTDTRYMVDMNSYKVMHGSTHRPSSRKELDENAMDSDTPPKGHFLLLLPTTIKGFGFHNKKWNELLVDHIRDIQWNKEAFDHSLVLEEQKKELIRALITVHIGKKRGAGIKDSVRADFMSGKGEGLLILLHGGPGTGKTLTAESVAEFAERPLYRVTCGDIGTDPESVEKYLESVLFIGSIWGCVVLLDEADVFLEERTKLDLDRNALVSVFLRVLEYYDGILILTSNRIGTIDEAFKSRVQLALHYPPLGEKGRLEVWQNLTEMLRDGGEDMDYDGIKRKLRTLAKHDLNGRQIRNTINTARQLARYKRETLRFVHIDQAIRNVIDFENYLIKLRGHTEEYAKEKELRDDVDSLSD